MPRFAANLSLMFTEVPFLDRFEAAAAAGFKGVEFLFPYAFEIGDLRARLDTHGLEVVLLLPNWPPPLEPQATKAPSEQRTRLW